MQVAAARGRYRDLQSGQHRADDLVEVRDVVEDARRQRQRRRVEVQDNLGPMSCQNTSAGQAGGSPPAAPMNRIRAAWTPAATCRGTQQRDYQPVPLSSGHILLVATRRAGLG